MRIERFQQLYLAEVSEAVSLEKIWARTAESLVETATNKPLRDYLTARLSEGRTHAEELTRLLHGHGADDLRHTDQSMEKLAQEAIALVEMVEPGPLRNAAMISVIQRIKHYKIAVFGTLSSYAGCLGHADDKAVFDRLLDDEKAFDAKLSEIAHEVVNHEALRQAA